MSLLIYESFFAAKQCFPLEIDRPCPKIRDFLYFQNRFQNRPYPWPVWKYCHK